MKLKDKVAIITGGAGGIGSGMALAMAKEGAKVVIVDVNEDKGRETEKALRVYSDSMFINGDITNKASIKGIVDDVVSTYGRLDILVNNAHVSKQVPIVETTDEVMALSFNTGFYPTFYFMQECYPHLKSAKGKVINFASGAGLSGMVNQASYAAAKEAIRGLSRVAANEWGADGINVNLISPIALTPGVEQWKQAFPEAYQEMVDKIPLKKMGDPEQDIGRVAVFLASSDSDYMTGQTLMVDGGSIMLR
ncbi:MULTISPECIES: SDR family oxidoreductase [Paenibacillus]|uniref:SDR family NAD(P)-dependent oxidoreductase n=1 Tax=Paenibacillus TaxID=44249 RepID=UPI000BBD83ED|nr:MULTISPECIES: SDR family oxidoreductase [Paenibacillus]PCL92104.1 oxidoreductase [Paenibacillus lautus]WFB59956.1 SDR family oxidoreductase [Paenibacillus sp. BR1-192]